MSQIILLLWSKSSKASSFHPIVSQNHYGGPQGSMYSGFYCFLTLSPTFLQYFSGPIDLLLCLELERLTSVPGHLYLCLELSPLYIHGSLPLLLEVFAYNSPSRWDPLWPSIQMTAAHLIQISWDIIFCFLLLSMWILLKSSIIYMFIMLFYLLSFY